MPKHHSPAVYVEDININPKPIKAVGTSTAGFLGETERGPTTPKLVTSWIEYQRVYGSYFGTGNYLPYAVEGFFKNGGQRCYIVRITQTNLSKATLILKNNSGSDALYIEAIGEGSWGKRLAIKTINNNDETFKLTVYYWKTVLQKLYNPLSKKTEDQDKPKPEIIEVYENVSVDPSSPDYFETKVNLNSNLIRISKAECGNAPPKNSESKTPMLLTGNIGDETKPISLSDYVRVDITEPTKKKGLSGLANIKDVSIIYIPNILSINGLYNELITHCEVLKDRFAIIDVAAQDPNPTKPGETKYGAFYCPWIKISDPKTGKSIFVPPGGHVAGIYARTDIERGVHKAPANEIVKGGIDLEYSFSKALVDTLNPNGINCIRHINSRGIRIWGARTMSDDPLWKYINIRRLFIYLEKSIYEGTQWVIFEPNDEKLWAKARQTVTEFLTNVWRNGALMGATPEKAFFIKCDRTTMTQDDINYGRINLLVGVAPLKPAEFVIFRISHMQEGSIITEG